MVKLQRKLLIFNQLVIDENAMKKLLGVCSLASLLYAQALCADTNLVTVYKQALEYDPQFKQAYSTYKSTAESVPQAFAALLPNVTGTASYAYLDTSAINNLNPNFDATDRYYQSQYGITATQPLFNLQAWIAVSQAKATTKQAQATFNSAAQDLIIRTAKAYFNVLLAADNVRYSIAKQKANQRQYDQASQRFKVGLDAITSVYEAKAALDASKATVISDKNNLINQYERLRKITNIRYKSLSPLASNKLPLVKPKPSIAAPWVKTALAQNYALQAARFGAIAARKNINQQAAGHLPTLSVQAQFNETDNHTDVPAIATDTNQKSATLNLNFPMFQGGLVLSQTRQAQYDYETAYQQLQQTYQDTLANTHISYNTIIDGISQIKADRQAIKSAKNSLESTEAQFQVGTRTMVDVTNAQEALFQAQTQLSTDQYNFIQAILQLKYNAGTLSPQDVYEVNSWLVGQHKYFPKKISRK